MATLLLLVFLVAPHAAQESSQAILLQDGVAIMESRGDHRAAALLFERAAAGDDPGLAARGLLYLGMAREHFARQQARRAYEALIERFPDQTGLVADARRRLRRLAADALPAAARPTVTARRLWGSEFTPTAPPRRRSEHVLGVTREGDVALRHAVSGVTRVLVAAEPSVVPVDAAISPDGNRLAVARWRSGPGPSTFELVVATASGEAGRVAYAATGPQVLFGGWFPDNRAWLVYRTLPGGVCQLHRVEISDGSVRVLATLPPGAPYKVTLSSDGRLAALDIPVPVPGAPSERDIALVSLSTGDVSILTHPAVDAFPVWTHDGRLLFVSDRTGSYGLWLQDVTAGHVRGEPVLVRRDIGSVLPPVGITDDGALFYRVTEGLVDIEVAPLEVGVPAARTVGRVGRRVQGINLFPDWSPDGESLVYTSRLGTLPFEPGAQTLVISTLASGLDRVLHVDLANMALPRWSPDGRTIAVQGSREARSGTYLVDVASGKVTDGPIPGQAGVEWFADGRALLLVKGRTLVRQPLDGGAAQVLYSAADGVSLGFQVLGPDQSRAAVAEYHKDGVRVVLVSLAGAPTREIHTAGPGRTLSLIGWSPDGATVFALLVEPAVGGKRSVWRLPTTGGTPVAAGIEHASMRDARLSPDGTRVACTAGWPTRATWVLEHFLPPPHPRAPAAPR